MERLYIDIGFKRTLILTSFRPALQRFKGGLMDYFMRDRSTLYLDVCKSNNEICYWCKPAQTPASWDVGYCNFDKDFGDHGLSTENLHACPCMASGRDVPMIQVIQAGRN